MPQRKTAHRRKKRFPFKEGVEATVVMPASGETSNFPFYLKQIFDCVQLGEFGYHTLYDGWYTIFHVPSGSFIGSMTLCKEARQVLKHLYLKVEPIHIEATRTEFSRWMQNVKRITDPARLYYNLFDVSYWSAEDDIPF